MARPAFPVVRDPVRVAVNPPGKAAEKIEQGVHFVNQGEKAALLAEYVAKHPGELAIVFGRTKHGSDKLAKLKQKMREQGMLPVTVDRFR